MHAESAVKPRPQSARGRQRDSTIMSLQPTTNISCQPAPPRAGGAAAADRHVYRRRPEGLASGDRTGLAPTDALFLTSLTHPLTQLVFPVVSDDDLIDRPHGLQQREILAVG